MNERGLTLDAGCVYEHPGGKIVQTVQYHLNPFDQTKNILFGYFDEMGDNF